MKKFFFIGFALVVLLLVPFGIKWYFNDRQESAKGSVVGSNPNILSGSCRILPEEFCKSGKFKQIEIGGKKYTYIGINVPPGTPIYAPISGELAKIQESGQYFSGFGGQITNPEKTETFLIKGDVLYQNMVYETVQEGQQIATIGDRGFKNLGGYNIAFTINRITQGGRETNIDVLKELFK